MRSGAPFGPEWVKGGCRRQADGTAGLPPAPEMPCAPRAVTLGANLGQTHSRQTTWLEPAVEELASTWPSCSNVAKWLAPHRTPS